MIEFSFYLDLFKWGLLSGLTFAASTALTSPFLILQRNSLFPHAITHILLLSLLILSLLKAGLPYLLHFPFLLGITLLLTLTIYLLTRFSHIFEDTATSLITYLSLALALIIAGKTSQFDATLLNYLFGSLLAVNERDFLESLLVLVFSLGFYLLYKDLWLTQALEKEVPGLNYRRGNLFFLLLITLQTMVGVKLMGVLLVSSFFVFSGTAALRLSPSFGWVVRLTALLNLLGILAGFILSVSFDLPFSGAVVIFMGLYMFLILKK